MDDEAGEAELSSRAPSSCKDGERREASVWGESSASQRGHPVAASELLLGVQREELRHLDPGGDDCQSAIVPGGLSIAQPSSHDPWSVEAEGGVGKMS